MNNDRKKILVLATGGTIASKPGADGLVPAIGVEALLKSIDKITNHYDITAKDILHLDSSNIQPEEWVFIAENIYKEYKDYDGIVVTHGTDTMAYTASVLSFMLQGIPIPVVFTGSQLPMLNPLSDASENLRYALAMAASEIGGIFIAFNRKIILGCRAVKVRTTSFEAFESVNFPYISKSGGAGLDINFEALNELRGAFNKTEFSLRSNLCTDVFLIKLTPGLNPMIFDMLLEMKYKGIVIEAFGAGGLHYINRDLISKLEKLVKAGISVLVSSQCLYEKSDLTLYEVGKKALDHGVISAYDMTTEAAVTKLMWTIGQTDDPQKVRKYLNANLVGEIAIDGEKCADV